MQEILTENLMAKSINDSKRQVLRQYCNESVSCFCFSLKKSNSELKKHVFLLFTYRKSNWVGLKDIHVPKDANVRTKS